MSVSYRRLFAFSFSCLLAGSFLAACGPVEGPESDLDCDAESASGLLIAPRDPLSATPYTLGYPPYAIDGCSLAYVAAPEGSELAGSLRLRDLSTGEETILAGAEELPRRPSIAGGVVAWEVTMDEKSVIRVWSGDTTVTVTGPFDHAAEPRAAEDGVVFTAFLEAEDEGDSDIGFVAPGDAAASILYSGPGQQRFADISATHVAFADFAEDPDGRFDEDSSDLADIAVVDRASGAVSQRPMSGKQAFPVLGAPGKVAYLSWSPDHPEPKLSQYDLLVGEVNGPAFEDRLSGTILTAQPYLRPAARGKKLFWVEWPEGASPGLFVRPIDLSAPAEQVTEVSGTALFGPSAAEHLTVVGAQDASGKMVLRAAER